MWLQVESALREAMEAPESSVETRSSSSSQTPRKAARRSYRNPEEISEEEMLGALRAHRWRLQAAAEHLGISRPSLYAKIDKSPNIRKAADLSRQEIEACFAQWGGDLDAMAEALEVSKRGLQLRMRQLNWPRS
jgi:two-component system nitrogen regulation response regulator GlnG